jgi:hypothetical protein
MTWKQRALNLREIERSTKHSDFTSMSNFTNEFLGYFPDFEKIRVGLGDYFAVSVSPLAI